MSNNRIQPAEATHPGELIRDELRERGMTQKQLSQQTGILPSVLSEAINGKRPLSLNMASALERALGIPATMWLNLQTQYDLDVANASSSENETVSITIPKRDRNLLREIAHKFGWACML